MGNYLSSDLTRARNAFSAYIFRVRLYVIIYKESQSETMLFVTALSKSLLLLRIPDQTRDETIYVLGSRMKF